MPTSTLIIRDFEKQFVIKPVEIAKLVQKLPKAHYRGLKAILYKSRGDMTRLNLPIGPTCKGGYYPEHRSIIIHDLVNPTIAPHIIYHEIGHYVFHRCLDSYARKNWTTCIAPNNPAVSGYGTTNTSEDFAESYAMYAQYKHEIKAKAPEKHRFIQKLFNEYP